MQKISSDFETSIELDSSEIVNSHRPKRLRSIPMSDSQSDDEYCEDNIISKILWRDNDLTQQLYNFNEHNSDYKVNATNSSQVSECFYLFFN